MPPLPVPRARLASSVLLAALVLSTLPGGSWDRGAVAGTAPSAHAAALPRPGATAPRGQPRPRVVLSAIDNVYRRVGYRLLGAAVVQRSVDGARRWTAILTAGAHTRVRAGCHPARYGSVTALGVNGLLPGTLFVATSGALGPAGRARRNDGCDAATGGLFVLRPDGRGGLRRTDSLAAGLPYAQDPHGASPRAYALLDLTTDPGNPDVVYADAAILPRAAAGRASPSAGLYRSLSGGRYWNPATFGLPRSRGFRRTPPRSALTIDPARTATVFDALGPALYRSTDRGEHWRAVRGIQARRWLRLFVNPFNPQLMYALTDRGLYHSRNAGVTWAALRDKRLPAPGRVRSLGFSARDAASVYVTPARGRALCIAEKRPPARPAFATALALTPQLYDRVVLALHTAPLTRARLTVVRGANRTGAGLATNASGFGYATVRLQGRVVPDALRVRVEIGRRSQVLKPWLPPGWVPGAPPRPPATATPTPSATDTATPSATPTLTPTATATMTPTATLTPTLTSVPIPTPYPASSLGAVWAWKALTPTLPPCPAPVTATATLTATPAMTPAITPAPSAPATQPMAPLTATATVPPPTATATDTATPSPTATGTPAPACDAGPPSPRQDYAAAWDNAGHRLYVFGGTNTKTSLAYNDLSAYSTITNAWTALTPLTPTVAPSGRYGAASAWDPALNELLVFGGMSGAGPYARFSNDVWAYAPATNSWTQLAPNGAAGAPGARSHAAAAWDATNNRLLIFGGETSESTTPVLTNDLWAFTPAGTGGAWAQLSANGRSQDLPPPRQFAQIAWDAPNGVLRLFGGKNAGSGAMSDTWTWSPSQGWAFENVPDQPPGRQAGGYYWDETHARFVVGPGVSMSGDSNDLWYYDPGAHDWLPIPTAPAPAPPLRQMARMVWDAADNEALLFGGRQPLVGASNDLWALVPTGAPGPAPTAQPQTHVAKGVDIGETVARASNKVLLTADVVRQVAASGAAYARLSFYIGDGATTWTPARLHAYEQVITMLGAQGIGVLGVAASGITGDTSAPDWLQNAHETTGGNGINPAIENYANQLALLVGHFHDAPYNVRRWEIWNEPNVPLAGCATYALSCLQQPSLYPSNFAALLDQAYTVVKTNAATQDVQLISGGIFGHSIGGAYSATSAGADYLGQTYGAGIATGLWPTVKAATGSYPLDAVGEHLYVDQSQRTTPAVIGTYLGWVHGAYAPYEPGGKGIAITEAGWRTGDANEPQVSPQAQALNLDTIFAAARRTGYVQDLSWFQLQDNPGILNGTSWGLLDRSGSPKPAFKEFQGQ